MQQVLAWLTNSQFGLEAIKSDVAAIEAEVTDPDHGLADNANSVGVSAPFVPGFYYEVVLEATDPNVLPSVHVWQDSVNIVIPGTLIPPGSWARLQ